LQAFSRTALLQGIHKIMMYRVGFNEKVCSLPAIYVTSGNREKFIRYRDHSNQSVEAAYLHRIKKGF